MSHTPATPDPQAAAPLSLERLAQLKKLAEAATPGPWALTSPRFAEAINTADDKKHVALANLDSEGESQCLANAAYIAAISPDVLMALLAQIEAARALGLTL